MPRRPGVVNVPEAFFIDMNFSRFFSAKATST